MQRPAETEGLIIRAQAEEAQLKSMGLFITSAGRAEGGIVFGGVGSFVCP